MPFASRFELRAVTSLVLLVSPAFGIAAANSNAPIVISQIYTPGGSGGGQTGYGHSYVELHNRSGAVVSLSG